MSSSDPEAAVVPPGHVVVLRLNDTRHWDAPGIAAVGDRWRAVAPDNPVVVLAPGIDFAAVSQDALADLVLAVVERLTSDAAYRRRWVESLPPPLDDTPTADPS